MGANNFIRKTFGSALDPLIGKAPEEQKMEAQEAPPTVDDARKKIDKSELAPKTYGRMGTIKNTGGMAGLASSVLNLSSRSLMGK